MWQSSSLSFPHPPLSTQAALPNKISCFDSTRLLGQFISKCQTRACSQAVEGVPPSCIKITNQEKISSKCVSVQKEMASTPVFLSGRSHGQRSLAGYSPTAGHFWKEETVPGNLRSLPKAPKLSMAQPELWLSTPSSQASWYWPLSSDTGVAN